MATKKKVTIVYDASDVESVLCAVALLSKYRKDTVQTLDINGVAVGDITTAIGTLTGSQEYLYVAYPSTSAWAEANETALKAKGAQGYTFADWTTSETTETLSMVRDMWDDMAFGSSPCEMVYLLGTPDVDLSEANLVKKAKYRYGVMIKATELNDGGTAIELKTDSDTLKFVADAMDLGLWSDVVNSAMKAATSIPDYSRFNLYDLYVGGEFFYNGLLIESYIVPDESGSSSSSSSS